MKTPTKNLAARKRVKARPSVTARLVDTPVFIQWLEVEHFTPEDHETVILRWDRSTGPVYRTGYFNDAKRKFVGSGDVDFQTQPLYFTDIESLGGSPVFVLPADAQSIEEMREQVALCFTIIDSPLEVADRILSSLNLIPPPKQKGGK